MGTRPQYYTLLSRTKTEPQWVIEFGDYELNVVQDERDDLRGAHDFVKGTQFKIIATGDKQSDIEERVAELNK